jgi:N-acetyl-alpha-D-muramate 1-phosphate uridylyltransferase
MKAMIFAAGLGTRLKPLTDTMPKALVPVGGKPLLEILIRKLVASGFTEIVINVHHFADQIIRFVEEHDAFGADVRFSDESGKLLETGGGIKKAIPLLLEGGVAERPFLVHNVDILSNVDLQDFYLILCAKVQQIIETDNTLPLRNPPPSPERLVSPRPVF